MSLLAYRTSKLLYRRFQTDKNNVEKIKDRLNYIFNREKFLVSFQKFEFENEFDNIIYINIDDLIIHSEKNGACKRNLYSLILKGLIFNDKTYAQQWL